MSTLVLRYNDLSKISSQASDLARKVDEYADNLSRKISRKIDSITEGSSSNTSSAKYYVNAKIKELNAKKSSYNNLAKGINRLIENAKRIDRQVAIEISNSQEKFLNDNNDLQISEWRAGILNWLIDFKNSSTIFNMIGNGLREIGTNISDMRSNIKYWYKCGGGKETMKFVAAMGGALVALALFVISFPASGFFEICGAISATITIINAGVNIATSQMAMKFAKDGDPAWAKIYGNQNKLSDFIRETNFKNSTWNRISYAGATLLDGIELICDLANISEMLKKFKFKCNFINNYFNKNTGLLSYMKPKKITNLSGVNIGSIDKHGEMKNTVSSIWEGVKAYMLDKPIDGKSAIGIRTTLNKNFAIDFKDFRKTIFNLDAHIDTFKYKVTGGGKISFDDWKKTFNSSYVKDTIRYNLKNNSLTGMFEKNLEWTKRREYIKTTAKGFDSIMNSIDRTGQILGGESDISKEVMKELKKKYITNFSDATKLFKKTGDFISQTNELVKSTYIYNGNNV